MALLFHLMLRIAPVLLVVCNPTFAGSIVTTAKSGWVSLATMEGALGAPVCAEEQGHSIACGEIHYRWSGHAEHPNVVASSEEGKWHPASGYLWEGSVRIGPLIHTPEKITSFHVTWFPGIQHRLVSNAIAGNSPNSWLPRPGYAWHPAVSRESRLAVLGISEPSQIPALKLPLSDNEALFAKGAGGALGGAVGGAMSGAFGGPAGVVFGGAVGGIYAVIGEDVAAQIIGDMKKAGATRDFKAEFDRGVEGKSRAEKDRDNAAGERFESGERGGKLPAQLDGIGPSAVREPQKRN